MDIKFNSFVKRFYIANMLGSFWFILPITVLFLQAHDISYFQIGILEAVNIAIILFLELPTGAFADLLGRRNSIIIGSVLSAIAMIIIGLSGTFLGFLIGFAFWGAGDAFMSGAWQALLFDKLKEYRKQKDFLKIMGQVKFLSTLPLITGLFIGPLLFSFSMSLPWILFGLLFLASGSVYFSIKELLISKKKSSVTSHIKQIKIGMEYLNQHKKIKLIIIFALVISIPMFLVNTYILQPYLKDIGFSILHFSIIFPVIYGLASLAGAYSYKIENMFGIKTLLIFMIAIEVFILLLMSVLSIPLIIVLIIVLYMNRDVNFMIVHNYINHRTKSNIRATVLSYWSMLTAGIFLISGLLTGYLLDIISLNSALLLIATAVAIFSICYILYITKQKKKI